MKKGSILILTICSMLVFGQKVSDYKYVSIPEKFTTFKEKFDLDVLLAKFLNGKKYVVLKGNKDQWPFEAKDNPCNVLNADVIDDSGFLRNKVILQFKDCHDKVLLASKGVSKIKEYKEGFQEALKETFVTIPVSYPTTVVMPAETKVVEQVKESPSTENVTSSTGSSASKYSNGKLSLQKVQIDNSQFILVRPDSSVPYATFKETTKKDVFRVKFENGDTTIGYYENGNIVIEVPSSNGGYSKDIFLGK
ncbi:hypothetical protein [Chryseobacterium paridis]|uniref:Beta-lactamase-inhibitor-like PepSY-like domain-containing protein n=1 Tax=Chryseobacterium paridis TaxID=2800328 RepID=A0ABS1FT95_9FLAO|nr:hypothetical protein [Chryseobacterium paridis]MBK1895473.1 hypothetical protein [Chryseobacterium paridis]